MKVLLAKHAGLCTGVRRALTLAMSAEVKPVFLLGNIAHNERVMSDLEKAGCRVISEEDLPNISNGSVVIRAHGVAPDLYDKLRSTGAEVIDATCPLVKKIHDLVRDYSDNGYTVLIIGDPKHPEVVGTKGYAKKCFVLDSLESAKSLEINPDLNYAVVCQTTFSEKIANNIIKHLKNNIKTLVINSTICYTTKERQLEAESLSRACDAVLVVGSSSSSNTT